MAGHRRQRATISRLWITLKHSSPLYTVFRRVTKRQAVLLLLIAVGELASLGSMVQVTGERGPRPGTQQVLGASVVGAGSGRGSAMPQGDDPIRFVSAERLGTLPRLSDDAPDWRTAPVAPGENLDGAGRLPDPPTGR